MLTARSVVFAIIAVAVLSAVSAIVSLFWSGDKQSILGSDSYGTRTKGYRAVHDLLEELDYETERCLIPATPSDPSSTSYLIWNPQERLVQTEPAYLTKLVGWVRDGGRLVVAPNLRDNYFEQDDVCYRCGQPDCDCESVQLLKELGLQGVSIKEIELADESTDEARSGKRSSRRKAPPEDFGDVIREVFSIKDRPTSHYPIAMEGGWQSLSSAARQVQLPADRFWSVSIDELEPTARVTVEHTANEEPVTLAAKFPLGQGEVVVVSNPYLASNANVAGVDNSVLLTHLFTGNRPRVVFDEFYHGLTVRGNALWLLSKRPYAVMTISMLAVVGVWIWRQAVFLGPSREERSTSRRSLGEYVEAMSRFMLNSRESARYTLSEVRDGVIWQFSKTLGLPPQQQDTDAILNLLSRRQPQQASQLEAALKYADQVLNNPRAPQDEILQATRKVSDCLST